MPSRPPGGKDEQEEDEPEQRRTAGEGELILQVGGTSVPGYRAEGSEQTVSLRTTGRRPVSLFCPSCQKPLQLALVSVTPPPAAHAGHAERAGLVRG